MLTVTFFISLILALVVRIVVLSHSLLSLLYFVT